MSLKINKKKNHFACFVDDVGTQKETWTPGEQFAHQLSHGPASGKFTWGEIREKWVSSEMAEREIGGGELVTDLGKCWQIANRQESGASFGNHLVCY